MWIFSTSHYASTVFPPMAKQFKFRVRAFQKVSFKHPWIKAQFSQAVLRLARISSGPTVQGAQLGAIIGFCIRRHGKKCLWDTCRNVQSRNRTSADKHKWFVIRSLIEIQEWHPYRKSLVEALRVDTTGDRASSTIV